MINLVMTYHRTGDTYAYHLTYMLDGALVERRGEDRPFSAVIYVLSEALRTCSADIQAVLRRSDRPGLDEIVLDNQLRDLIRQDPDKYLAIVTEPDRVVVVGDLKAKQSTFSATPYIRTGYDTLAEAFGDSVYVRLRDDGRVECPCCGRWSAHLEDIDTPYTRPDGSVPKLLVCVCLLLAKMSVTSVSGSWVELNTVLLATDAVFTRFYLPRSWNPAGWISRDDLKQMYESYIKESEHV